MSTVDITEHPEHRSHVIDFLVDGEKFETRKHELTARQILELAGLDPSTHYLVKIQGRHQIPYQKDPDAEIRLHEGVQFISVSTGPTPVS